MRQLAVVLLLVALVSSLLSCGGGTFVVASSGRNVSFSTVSGTISIVQLTIINGDQVTVVTLINNGGASTFNFCGNAVNRFPADTFVVVDFSPNGACSNVLHVK